MRICPYNDAVLSTYPSRLGLKLRKLRGTAFGMLEPMWAMQLKYAPKLPHYSSNALGNGIGLFGALELFGMPRCISGIAYVLDLMSLVHKAIWICPYRGAHLYMSYSTLL